MSPEQAYIINGSKSILNILQAHPDRATTLNCELTSHSENRLQMDWGQTGSDNKKIFLRGRVGSCVHACACGCMCLHTCNTR